MKIIKKMLMVLAVFTLAIAADVFSAQETKMPFSVWKNFLHGWLPLFWSSPVLFNPRGLLSPFILVEDAENSFVAPSTALPPQGVGLG